ncbi:MAG: DUF5677 domain-containing protein [Treponema sp.]|jgi:hypothetical protein|nr:DUF5677 domain-containing protein [Treponema sp.]
MKGNDENDGLSVDTALKTLEKAIERARKGSIKRITINGSLDGTCKNKIFSYDDSAFTISGTGLNEIIISGDTTTEITKLSGLINYEGRRGVGGSLEKEERYVDIIHVIDNANIRFENIRISNGVENKEREKIGLYISGKNCKVILGEGAEICNNYGNGIYIDNGAKLIIAGGKIYKNTAKEGGGIYIKNGECILEYGEVVENQAEYGGGIFQYSHGNFQILGGKIYKNNAVFTGGGIYISNGAHFTNRNSEIFENSCKEELGKDIFNQNLLGVQNIENKILFPEEQIAYFNEIISECRKMPEIFNNDETLIEVNYADYCSKKAMEIINMHKSDETINYTFGMLNLVNKYLISFWNYIVSTNENKSNTYKTLNNLLFSAIKKFGLIVQLMENEDYENGLIMFRSFYENIIITEFLSFHHDCIKPFEQFSLLRIRNRLPREALEKNISYQELFDEIKKEYTKDTRKDYAWAQEVIRKDEIFLSDIAKTIFEKSKLTDEMYKMSSELLHSNTGILNDYHLSDILRLVLKKYMKELGIPFITKTFLDVFHESNYFDVNIFLKIIENILDIEYKYKLNIR